MLVPLTWLTQWIDLPQSPEEISDLLTSMGLEVDRILNYQKPIDGVVVARVLEVQPHPNADKLHVAKVWDGQKEWPVVCGASNCEEGRLVAFATIGTYLRPDFQIKKVKLRGLESYGMLCALEELGYEESSEGIIHLHPEASVGSNAMQEINDPIFEVSLTPNLGHCFGIRGIARELSAKLNGSLKAPHHAPSSATQGILEPPVITVDEDCACFDYMGCRILGWDELVSSSTITKRLEQVGVRAIHPIVDITNDVMWELGHPVHAFDAKKVRGNICVRRAKKGERTITLDGIERVLDEEMTVIADDVQVIAIAGVMGSQACEVDEGTREIILEVANFDPASIRRTSRKLGLSTESSKRFERGVDPLDSHEVLQRIVYWLSKASNCGVKTSQANHVFVKNVYERKPIFVDPGALCRLIGVDLSINEIQVALQRLFIDVQKKDSGLLCTPPSWRHDLKLPVDFAEEVLRIIGLDGIEQKKCQFPMDMRQDDPFWVFERKLRHYFCSRGFNEIITPDLVDRGSLHQLGLCEEREDFLAEVLNPSHERMNTCRPHLLLGMLEAVKHNQDHACDVLNQFELGSIYSVDGEKYLEKRVLALLFTEESAHDWTQNRSIMRTFYDMKSHIQSMSESLRLEVDFVESHIAFLHPGQQAKVMLGTTALGWIGQIHPRICASLGIHSNIFFAQLELEALLLAQAKKNFLYSSVSQYPKIKRDWTITVTKACSFAQFKASCPKHLELIDLNLLSVWEDYEKLGAGVKNMTLRFMYQHPERTLKQEEIDELHEEIKRKIQERLHAYIV